MTKVKNKHIGSNFDDFLQEQNLLDECESSAKSETENLYHYCSLASFYGIISSKSIWLSAASQSNDSKELTHFYNILDSVSYDVDMNVGKKKILQYSKWLPFFFCLSENDDLLSQWRYGAYATGVAIGFNKSAIINLLKNTNAPQFQRVKLANVIYNQDIQKEIMTRCLSEGKLSELIHDFFPRFKNSSFFEEKEWRLFCGLVLGKDKFTSFDSIKFRVSDNKMLMHLEMSIKDYLSDLVREIIIGPKSQMDERALSYFLMSNGLENVKIRTSNISLQ